MSELPRVPGYEVSAQISHGGMGEIFRGRALAGDWAGLEVALKRLSPRLAQEPAYEELFLAEAQLGALFAHPCVTRTFEVVRHDGALYLVMELVDAGPLQTLSAHAARSGEPLSMDASLVVISDVLAALEHLHQHPSGPVVHRDVNPGNVLLSAAGMAKVSDFGIASTPERAAREEPGALRGTPAYMSPEQVRGRPPDVRADLFSAGILLWELVANRPLFHDDSEFESLRLVCEAPVPPLDAAPAAVAEVARRALERDPARRFQSARQMRRALVEAARDAGLALDRDALAREVRRLGAAPAQGAARPATVTLPG